MITLKRHTGWLGMITMIIFLASCSSTSNLPSDDIYYSKKVKDKGEYNWDDFQKSAQSYNTGTVESQPLNNSSDDIATTVEGSDAQLSNSDNQYYNGDNGSSYEERIKHFGDDASSTNFGYYDGYYTNNNCNYGPSSNWSFGFGYGGYGYGTGWSIGYGYGWPHNYGYGSSYWAGYNAGYWDGYYNGYWGYPSYYGYGYPYYNGYPYYYGYPSYGYGGYYGGGYYDYGIGSPSVVHGPRNSRGGGTNIPRSGSRSGSQDDGQKSSKNVIVDRNTRATSGGGDVSTLRSSDEHTGTLAKPDARTAVSNRSIPANTEQDKLNKPVTTRQEVTAERSRYDKPVTTSQELPKPKYQKPKSYQSLPSQTPRSGQEYIRPTTRTPVTRSTGGDPYIRSTRPVTNNNRSISNTRSSSSTPSRNYSSPSRSNSSRSSSYSSPSIRNSGSSSYSRSSGSSSIRSSGSSSSTRSSGSGSSSSRSSSGGGRRR